LLVGLKAANLALRFLLELTALGALGYWGAQRGTSLWIKVLLALLLPSVMIVVWYFFVAPKAPRGGTRAQRLLVGLVVFFAAAAATADAGYATLGVAFGAVALLNTVLVYATGPQPGETSRPSRP
jgi:hypothetical protein